jgi:hypothetical protein
MYTRLGAERINELYHGRSWKIGGSRAVEKDMSSISGRGRHGTYFI